MKILVLHGPNMNLIGLRSAKSGTHVTLDKIDRALRRQVRNRETSLKILQTHDEAKAVTFLHRNRNLADGLLISPESWHTGAFTLADTLSLINIPFITVSFKKPKATLFHGIHAVVNDDPVAAYEKAIVEMKRFLDGKDSKI